MARPVDTPAYRVRRIVHARGAVKYGIISHNAGKTKAIPIPVRGACKAGLQEEVQAHDTRHGLEHALAFADVACDEGRL